MTCNKRPHGAQAVVSVWDLSAAHCVFHHTRVNKRLFNSSATVVAEEHARCEQHWQEQLEAMACRVQESDHAAAAYRAEVGGLQGTLERLLGEGCFVDDGADNSCAHDCQGTHDRQGATLQAVEVEAAQRCVFAW